MMFGRKLKTKEEKEFWEQAYNIGMQNPWASGQADLEYGNPIVEEDRLNKNSCSVIDDSKTLKEFFKAGNWCLGQAVIYKNLCFIQQVDGGDEWLTIKRFSNGKVKDFESVSFERMIKDREFNGYLKAILKAKLYKKIYNKKEHQIVEYDYYDIQKEAIKNLEVIAE